MQKKEKRILVVLAFANFILMAFFLNKTIFRLPITSEAIIPTLAVLTAAENTVQSGLQDAEQIVVHSPPLTENRLADTAIQSATVAETLNEEVQVNPVETTPQNNTIITNPVQPIAVIEATQPQNIIIINPVNTVPQIINGNTNQNTNTTPLNPIENHTDAVPNQLVLRFDANTAEANINAALNSLNATVVQRIDTLDSMVVQLPQNADMSVLSAAGVEFAEPNYYVNALHTPNDPRYSEQWALPVLGMPDAWHIWSANMTAVTVAVVDSGVYAAHPDLMGRVGAGWDFVENDGNAQDTLGHGTGIAGIIAANTDNHTGISGIANNVRIMPLRVLDGNGAGTYANVAAAIVYATDNGADIINLSLGGANPSSLLEDAVEYAASHNVLVVAAAGNTGTTQVLYPAAYNDVIAVGAVDSQMQRSSFSSYGSAIDLYAPGSSILTTSHDGGYVLRNGTSFAAAHVSGIAAVNWALGSELIVDGGIVHVNMEAVVVQPTTEPPVSTPEVEIPTDEPADSVVTAQEVEGYLNVAYGDPEPGSGEPAKFMVYLTDGINQLAILNIAPLLALQYDFNYVRITGEFDIIDIGDIDIIDFTLQDSATLPRFRVDTIERIEAPSPQNVESQALLSGSKPFVMVLCRFNGDPSEPQTPAWYGNLFSSTYPGLDHYWRQISYDNINLIGTQVTTQWYEMPNPRTDYINSDGDALLGDLAADCANAANADVNFPDFVGIHFVFNDSLDCCAWGGGVTLTIDGETKDYPATWLPPWSQAHDVIAHEMGHAFGFPHSSGPADNVPSDLSIYVSQWDIMSASGGTCTTTNATFGGCIGQGTIAHHLNLNEWIPGGRKDTAADGTIETFTMGPPQPLQADGSMLLVSVPVDGSSELFYTVELRNHVTGLNSYDQNIPQDAVIIHEVLTTREGNGGPSMVVDADDGNDSTNDAGAMWLAGETYFDATNNIYIAVQSITTTGDNDPINASVCVVNDTAETTAPDSAHNLSGTLGNNGYWRSTVLVELTATDDCTNVEDIFYTVDGGSTQTYGSGFIVGGDGAHTVTYYAVDFAGNIETENSVIINIDTTPPVTTEALAGTAGLNGWWISDVTVTLSAVDNFSGVAATTYRLDGGAVQNYTGAFVITGDGEHTLQFSSEDLAGNFEDVQEIIIKIDTTPPVIEISTDAGQYTRVDLITFTIVAYDPMPGSGLMSVTAEMEGEIISDGTVIDPFWFDLGVYEFTATATDFAGLSSTDDGSFELIATLESLSPTVTRLCEELHISKHGICNSLQAKLRNALRADGRGQTHVVINMLNAFLHELNAQNGKSISSDAYRILEQDVRYVIESLGGTAVTASSAMVIEPLVIEPLAIEPLEPEVIEAVPTEAEVEDASVEVITPEVEAVATEPEVVPTEAEVAATEVPVTEVVATEAPATEPPAEATTEINDDTAP
jgi:thermitase